jgi:hypothetical protein
MEKQKCTNETVWMSKWNGNKVRMRR